MKTLLIIHSYKGAENQVKWSWPHYLVPGWDILGVTPYNSVHSWPDKTPSVGIAAEGYTGTHGPVDRLVGTFEHVLKPEFSQYSDFCIIEYDGVFLRKPPSHPGGLHTHLSGGGIQGYKAPRFFHTPWWADRPAAQRIVEEGKKLIANNEYENGSPDFFLALAMERGNIQWTQSKTWSVNGGNFWDRRDQAAEPIKQGIWYLHGIRTREDLDWILHRVPK